MRCACHPMPSRLALASPRTSSSFSNILDCRVSRLFMSARSRLRHSEARQGRLASRRSIMRRSLLQTSSLRCMRRLISVASRMLDALAHPVSSRASCRARPQARRCQARFAYLRGPRHFSPRNNAIRVHLHTSPRCEQSQSVAADLLRTRPK